MSNKRIKQNHVDPTVHATHLRRLLDSLEKDNHSSIHEIDELIHSAITAQEEEGRKLRKSRIHNKTSLNALLEDNSLSHYMTCQVQPSIYPSRHFCSVCGYPSQYTCLKCGMKYCSTHCLSTHKETRCLKWT
ncbi:hypothetical protein BDB01DRAFT_855537 [Pilobolus umbonatus]|nr:hypothetical protein BDB01DRAFT_855537 [Pilobolus umbonatus]